MTDTLTKDRRAEILALQFSAGYALAENSLPQTMAREMHKNIDWLLDHTERLQERCEAYKGQVKAGADEIERLRTNSLKVTGIPGKVI